MEKQSRVRVSDRMQEVESFAILIKVVCVDLPGHMLGESERALHKCERRVFEADRSSSAKP